MPLHSILGRFCDTPFVGTIGFWMLLVGLRAFFPPAVGKRFLFSEIGGYISRDLWIDITLMLVAIENGNR